MIACPFCVSEKVDQPSELVEIDEDLFCQRHGKLAYGTTRYKMRAILQAAILCPCCKNGMTWLPDHRVVCNQPRCRMRGRAWDAPTVELVQAMPTKPVVFGNAPEAVSES